MIVAVPEESPSIVRTRSSRFVAPTSRIRFTSAANTRNDVLGKVGGNVRSSPNAMSEIESAWAAPPVIVTSIVNPEKP